MFELPHEFSNDLKLTILRNKETSKTRLKYMELNACSQPVTQNIIFEILKNSKKSTIKISIKSPILLDLVLLQSLVATNTMNDDDEDYQQQSIARIMLLQEQILIHAAVVSDIHLINHNRYKWKILRKTCKPMHLC